MPGESYSPYNPLAIKSIADSVVRELLGRPCGPLPPASRFNGAGIYALYYTGNFQEYALISQQNQSNCEYPIYVGKAVPQGSRKGVAVTSTESTQALYNRLAEHAESIRAASASLNLDDFNCRYLVVEELFIELSERTLIQNYKPVWNACLGGFGNHDPGSGRYNQRRSSWDEVHRGRAWADKLQPSDSTADQWKAIVRDYIQRVQAGVLAEVPIVDDGAGENQGD